jgi:hypothetical protein
MSMKEGVVTMADMTPKSRVPYQGTLGSFADNEDGRGLLIPGKQIRDDDSTDTDGNLHHLRKINRFDLPEGFNFLGGLRGYIFMTRPDLNIWDIKNNGQALSLAPSNASKVGLRELMTNGTPVDKENLSALQQNSGFPSPYMPIFTNFCKGYSPEDQMLDVVELGETHHGMKVKYGKHLMHSRSTGTFSLTLQDTKFLSVYKNIAVWTDYIEMAFLGDISPKDYYIKQGILDYAVSLFYLVTKQDGSELVYWEKLLGVFPKSRPDSAFATTKDQLSFPEYSVQFEYSLKSRSSVLDPVVLSEMNTLAGFAKKDRSTAVGSVLDNINSYFPAYDAANHTIGIPFVNAPKIEFINGKFYLRWV